MQGNPGLNALWIVNNESYQYVNELLLIFTCKYFNDVCSQSGFQESIFTGKFCKLDSNRIFKKTII